MLSHYPLVTWNRAYREAWYLHGHSHGNLRAPATTRLDVGVECFKYTPVSYEQIASTMAQRSYLPSDHHNDNHGDHSEHSRDAGPEDPCA